MNKIEYDTQNDLSSENIWNIPAGASVLHVTESMEIQKIIFPNEEFDVTIVLEERRHLELHALEILENVNGNIKMESKTDSTLIFHLGLLAKGQNHLTIQNEVSGNNSTSEIKIRLVGEENSHTVVKTRGSLKKDTIENKFLEDVKYLNEEQSYIECLPELFVDSNEVEAIHNVSIGRIRDEDLFYLESKGIEEDKARQVIRECFLKSMLK